MGLIFGTDLNWFFVVFYLFLVWLVAFVYRKGYKKQKEFMQQIYFGLLIIILGPITDVIGTYVDLWHYVGGDLPVIIFLSYFFTGLAGYQLVKLLTEGVK